MEWKRSSAVAIVALALSAGTLQTASAAEGDEVSATPVEVTTLAQVTPLGLKVTGVALKYDGDLGTDEVPISAFGVETDLPSENPDADPADEIGRASCRARAWRSGGAAGLAEKT